MRVARTRATDKMERESSRSEESGQTSRRNFLIKTGVSASVITGMAGCVGIKGRDTLGVTQAVHGLLKIGRAVANRDQLKYDSSLFDQSNGSSVVRPDIDQEGYWQGAPYPLSDGREIYLYYRSRDPNRRGWKATIAKTEDGINISPVVSFTKQDISATSIEGGAIEKTGEEYVLYLSYLDSNDGRWKIQSTSSSTVSRLGESGWTNIDFTGRSELYHIKDPLVLDGKMVVHANSQYFLSGATLLTEREGHRQYSVSRELSIDDKHFNRFRITSALRLDDQWLVFYDGERSALYTWEEKGGVATSSDLRDLDPILDQGVLRTQYGTGSLRYLRSIIRDTELWVYYEASMPGGGHEIKMNKIELRKVRDFLSNHKTNKK
jgi:hypothetical protein